MDSFKHADVLAPQPVAVASGVYYFEGSTTAVSPQNQGFVGNSGFIVGPTGVTVIDTGSSYQRGEAILASIRRITDQPIRLVIITHARREFLFGNAAFAELGIPIMAHSDAVALMRVRCTHCLENLTHVLGEDAMKGTRLVLPTQIIAASQTMEVGGRMLDIMALNGASAPGDIAVFDRASGVLFAGEWLVVNRLPMIQDAHVEQWIAALNQLPAPAVRAIIPGYGPAVWAGGNPEASVAMTALQQYLMALEVGVRGQMAEGVGLNDTTDAVALPQFKTWGGYEDLQHLNVHYRYLQLESVELLH
jgi:glyoxylase-like metal-dependent hydrolase (beta-lactamase superfamily II)